ncbi:MAG: transposase [Verrucomicrobiota bacterium]
MPEAKGFRGFSRELHVTVFYRNLPHWRQEGATYFVTFRMADALPQSCLDELTRIRCEWERQKQVDSSALEEAWKEIANAITGKAESYLDSGHGSCLLRDKENANIVEELMRRFDGERYDLGAYVVMPNHVHAVVKPLTEELSKTLKAWKGVSARRINQQTSTKLSHIWQDESYDRIIRDPEHLYEVIRYIGANPK